MDYSMTSKNAKQTSSFNRSISLCVDCKKPDRLDGFIRCAECEGKYQLKLKQTNDLMNKELCPNCNIEIGIHAEFGLKKCLFDLRGYNPRGLQKQDSVK